jgi:hypothetical protein
MPGYHELTLLRNATILHGPTIMYLSAINIEYRVYYTCLMLVASAEILNRVLLCGRHSYDCSERKQSHVRS